MATAQTICAACGGTGWKMVERDGLSAAERCECAAMGRSDRIQRKSNIPDLYRNSKFEDFVPYNNLLQDAKRTAIRYADEFPVSKPPLGLVFCGDTGSGKTHLAIGVMKHLIDKGYECVFFDYQQLLDRLRSSYDPAAGGVSREAYRTALDCEVLVLDDLGAHRVTDWVEDTITSILTQRCNENRPLIATTNLRDVEFGDGLLTDHTAHYTLEQRIGKRARSRLFEMCRKVSLRGVDDYRVRAAR
jgi:DNA replication protein DnaC